jgi:predicted AlkP superfamily phosphohydrolase/phosphomutase
VHEATDRVQHMFYRYLDEDHPLHDDAEAVEYGDTVLEVYQRADEIVGQVMESLDGNTLLIVLSDHGFNSFRRAVNLNTHLAMQGFLKLKPVAGSTDRTLHDLFGHGEFWPNVDWTGSKAYALGLGQVYINLRGREKDGLVEPGEEYEQVIEEVRQSLLRLRDPENGKRMIISVSRGDEIYHGPYTDQAPDLVVGFAPGYRVSWQTCLGGMPEGIVVDNDRRWSGDHCSVDPAHTKGTLLSNRPLFVKDAGVMDIAPTILRYLEVEIPDDVDGRPLL